MRSRLIVVIALMALLAVAAPAAAEGDDHTSDLRTYEVTLTNRATGQPISPPVLVTHDRDIRFWQRGTAASAGIVAIAEDGNPAVAVSMLDGVEGVTDVVNVGRPLTRKGTTVGDFTDSVTITIQARPGDRLSFAGMLICTNDGFTGIDSLRLPDNSRTRVAYAGGYDAGSEINTERSEDIVDACSLLGPVVLDGDDNGNENAAVDANGVVSRHRGIVGESDLLSAHNWNRGVVKIKVKMIDA
jgi:hypothetical protein